MGETDQDVKFGMPNAIKKFIILHPLVGRYEFISCSKLDICVVGFQVFEGVVDGECCFFWCSVHCGFAWML